MAVTAMGETASSPVITDFGAVVEMLAFLNSAKPEIEPDVLFQRFPLCPHARGRLPHAAAVGQRGETRRMLFESHGKASTLHMRCKKISPTCRRCFETASMLKLYNVDIGFPFFRVSFPDLLL
jgi:hypothetical protein